MYRGKTVIKGTYKEKGEREIILLDLWSGVSNRDIEILKRQSAGRRFDASIVFAVARRCLSGCPQVIACHPIDSSGRPFPTLFWLTCPHLSRLCGELESKRLITELEEIFKEREKRVHAWHKRYVLLRRSLGQWDMPGGDQILPSDDSGVGGVRWRKAPHAVKCIHLQTATWLGMRQHPASDWLGEHIRSFECDAPEMHCLAHG